MTNEKKPQWFGPKESAEFSLGELPECVLYEAFNFQSALPPIRTNLGCEYFAQNDPWNDAISSIIVVRGSWEFYQDHYCTGPSIRLGPGYYPDLNTKGWNDRITSFKPITF